MLIDITLPVTPEMRRSAPEKEDRGLTGHLGTHFDVMNKTFPLEFTKREGIAFDVSSIRHRDVEISDVPLDRVEKGQFVIFYTGFSDEVSYGAEGYFGSHPQLSHTLIDALLEKGVSIIGIDCSGIRRGKEHTPADQRCADQGVFVVENLVGLRPLIAIPKFTVHTYPVHFLQMTGLPCRVIAEL